MKKISIIMLVALVALTMVSCNKYGIKKVNLENDVDSLNYALGVINGAQLKQMYFAEDDSKTPIKEFIDELDKAYKSEEDEQPSEYALAGKQVGNFFKTQATNGLAGNKAWKYDNKISCQAFVNGLYGYDEVLTINAQEYFQNKYAAAVQQPQPEEVATSKISEKCPYTAANVELATESDSLNYAFGYLNGEMMAKQMIANFDQDSIKVVVDNLNAELMNKVKYPLLVADARNIAHALKDMPGLLGDTTMALNFDLVRSGFINSMNGDEEIMNLEDAQVYIQQTMMNREQRNNEPNRAAGEAFLAQNAQRAEVTVTESGLQYEVLQKGKGKVHPADTDIVSVHYHGTLIDGTVFDSSVERGQPTEFRLNQVIAGWTEGVQLMVVGDKYRFYIPYQLGYGERGAGGQIKPYSALIFDVELLDIK